MNEIRMSLAELKQRLMETMIEEGTEFSKCANCGDVYPLGHDDWWDLTVCSERCHSGYVAYLNGDG